VAASFNSQLSSIASLILVESTEPSRAVPPSPSPTHPPTHPLTHHHPQGPTSSGKTSLVGYLAAQTGHTFVRINNHQHTDLQEYLGSWVPDEQGECVDTVVANHVCEGGRG
jgi:hypothetical protein